MRTIEIRVSGSIAEFRASLGVANPRGEPSDRPSRFFGSQSRKSTAQMIRLLELARIERTPTIQPTRVPL